MAEDFPHYRHEDSDDNPPSDRPAERSAPAPAPEQHAPVQQEGTIFSRDEVAPHLSRPLFEFIRKQEQPGGHAETTTPPKAELPSVSLPSDPEVQTYQPPTDAEVAQAIHQTNAEQSHAEDDDDDEDEAAATDDHASASPPPPVRPAAEPRASERSLNEQFDEIIRAEMGPDFAVLTSGNKLGETFDAAETDEEPAAQTGPEVFAMPNDIPEEVPIPDGVTEEGAFYYNEDAPEDTAEDPLAVAVPNSANGRATGNGGGTGTGGGNSGSSYSSSSRRFPRPVPATPPPAAGGGGTGTGGGPGGPSGPTTPSYSGGPNAAGGKPLNNLNAAPSVAPNMAANLATNPNFAAPAVERRENHNGRWFVAGFVTGWVIKQHLANRKMARVQNQHRQEIAGQNQQIDSLQMRQQNMQREIRTNEGQLQEARANQLKAADERSREQARVEQAAKVAAANAPAAERPAAQAPSAEMPLQAPAAEQSQAQAPAEQSTAAMPAAEQPAASPRATAEMPLSQTGGGAEAAFAAAGGALNSAETPLTRALSSETPATAAEEAAVRAERTALTPHEAAQDAVAQAYELQNGEHVVHAAGGGHNIIVDRHGHEVEGAMQYADEFRFQQRQERARAGAFDDDEAEETEVAPEAALDPAQQQARAIAAQQQRRRSGAGLNYGANIVTGLASGLPNAAHEIGAGMSDARKRLTANIPSKNANPVVATLASPWLWASVFVLLAAFFAAAFI